MLQVEAQDCVNGGRPLWTQILRGGYSLGCGLQSGSAVRGVLMMVQVKADFTIPTVLELRHILQQLK
ncbi:hypothetical protein KUCAC02_023992 [Chaenocephalus aceratus]|uniref:Uncharacterized protein n=1 Tax=Chaenocephalus aceratus TaxID=36190 RepID=A0ACB9WHL9_CHAAC|nr:hypothetical protein KUCAC02_023992 [Chaenocephalus aceratus]